MLINIITIPSAAVASYRTRRGLLINTIINPYKRQLLPIYSNSGASERIAKLLSLQTYRHTYIRSLPRSIYIIILTQYICVIIYYTCICMG